MTIRQGGGRMPDARWRGGTARLGAVALAMTTTMTLGACGAAPSPFVGSWTAERTDDASVPGPTLDFRENGDLNAIDRAGTMLSAHWTVDQSRDDTAQLEFSGADAGTCTAVKSRLPDSPFLWVSKCSTPSLGSRFEGHYFNAFAAAKPETVLDCHFGSGQEHKIDVYASADALCWDRKGTSCGRIVWATPTMSKDSPVPRALQWSERTANGEIMALTIDANHLAKEAQRQGDYEVRRAKCWMDANGCTISTSDLVGYCDRL